MMDTFPQWLFQRYGKDWGYDHVMPGVYPTWDNLSDDDKLYWYHEAAAVKRAVERGGFKV